MATAATMSQLPKDADFVIRVPGSSANIGPGFDAIGLALTVYLEIHVTYTRTEGAAVPLNCSITYEDTSGEKSNANGDGQQDYDDNVSLRPDDNLITRTTLYVLRCHGLHEFPQPVHVHVRNGIPLGRGLGSSGAAVAAGVMLADEVGKLSLSRNRILDFCLMIERHPDNVAASVYGGFVGTYLRELSPSDLNWREIPLSEVLPAPAGGVDTGKTPPQPPLAIGHALCFPFSPAIRVLAIIPNFEVPTAEARNVLPAQYARADIVYNVQRAALLPTALGAPVPDPDLIYLAMQDKLHQPYRKTLIPGLTQILQTMTPSTQPGLLGICLSGAGPTILALVAGAHEQHEQTARAIVGKFEEFGVQCQWKLLQTAEGASVVARRT